jgi:hypothetical protein
MTRRARTERSNQLESWLAAHQRGRTLQRLDRDVTFVGIEDAVDLLAAGAHHLSEALFRDPLLLHLTRELQRNHALVSATVIISLAC